MRKKPIPEVIKEPFRRTRFYARPGVETIGYRYGDIKIMRKRSETIEELRLRCKSTVQWPDINLIVTFISIYERSAAPAI